MAMLGVDKAADSSKFTEESFWQHGDEVNELFAERWTAVMPPETPPPDMAAFLKFMALDLKTTRGEMVDTAHTHETQLGTNSVLRVERDQSESELIARYVETRTIFDAVYGRERAKAMGFSYPRKDVPSRFERQTKLVLKNFKALPADEPIPTPKGKEQLALKPRDIIDVLELPYNQLGENLKNMLTAVRQAQKTQTHKEKCFKKQVETYSMHAKCGEMIYRMVGLTKEAEQIKPSTRRPGQREVEVEETEGDAPAQSADSAAAVGQIAPAAVSATVVGAEVASAEDS